MITHYAIIKINGDIRYLCNQACNITDEKVKFMKEDVTCKNCLRMLNKKSEDRDGNLSNR